MSRLIDKELVAGNINGVRMNIGGLAFTHVMYADDIILFTKANCREVKILDACIEKYAYDLVKLSIEINRVLSFPRWSRVRRRG